MTLYSLGNFSEMERRAYVLLRQSPDSPIILELLGMALAMQGRHKEALPLLEKAVRKLPNDAQFWENLALCQRQLLQYEAAANSLRRSLTLRPKSVEALNALASVLRSLGREVEAKTLFEKVLEIEPNHLAARVNLAKALAEERRFADAERHLTHAIVVLRNSEAGFSKETVDLWGVIADIFSNLDRHAEANKVHKEICAFDLAPRRAIAAMLPARRVCDWKFAASIEPFICHVARTQSDQISAGFATLLYLSGIRPQDQLSATRRHAHMLAAGRPSSTRQKASKSASRLRVGYLSNDFCSHAVGHVLVGVIEAHDRERFEICAFDYSAPSSSDDEYRCRFQKSFDTVHSIYELSDDQAAKLISDSGVNIVIDLKGWTQGDRAGVLISRPSPIQVQWLGYPGTMGAPWIDYIIADTMLIPEGKEAGFSEKIIRLPRTSMPYERRRVANPIVRKDCGLPDDAFVFCSFNQSVKITGEIFSVWMKLLKAVDRSVLWLQQTSVDVMTALHETAKLEGIDPAKVIFAKFLPERDAHLARLSNADLALDCFPYSSHVTACDALSAGVPLIGLIGDTFASRVSSSILLAAGLAELITASFEEYFDAALRLAKDRRKLASLRTKLTDNPPSAIPLFDTEGFTRNLEAAYLTVWERHLAGFPPDHLTVNPKPISAD